MSMKRLAIIAAVNSHNGYSNASSTIGGSGEKFYGSQVIKSGSFTSSGGGHNTNSGRNSSPYLDGNINILIGGAMLSVVTIILCLVCYCCHRTMKRRSTSTTTTATIYRSRWLENDPNMEIYSVEQCYDTAGLFTSDIPEPCSLPINHGPPPSYDAVVAMDEIFNKTDSMKCEIDDDEERQPQRNHNDNNQFYRCQSHSHNFNTERQNNCSFINTTNVMTTTTSLSSSSEQNLSTVGDQQQQQPHQSYQNNNSNNINNNRNEIYDHMDCLSDNEETLQDDIDEDDKRDRIMLNVNGIDNSNNITNRKNTHRHTQPTNFNEQILSVCNINEKLQKFNRNKHRCRNNNTNTNMTNNDNKRFSYCHHCDNNFNYNLVRICANCNKKTTDFESENSNQTIDGNGNTNLNYYCHCINNNNNNRQLNDNLPSTSNGLPTTTTASSLYSICSDNINNNYSLGDVENAVNVIANNENDNVSNINNSNNNNDDTNNNNNNNNNEIAMINFESLNENGLIRLDMSQIIDKTGLPTYEAALKLESSGYV